MRACRPGTAIVGSPSLAVPSAWSLSPILLLTPHASRLTPHRSLVSRLLSLSTRWRGLGRGASRLTSIYLFPLTFPSPRLTPNHTFQLLSGNYPFSIRVYDLG